MPDVDIHRLELGELATCCYILSRPPETGAVVVDPGGREGEALASVTEAGLRVEAILLTHCHYDHIGGVEDLARTFPDAAIVSHDECGRRMVDPALNLSSWSDSPLAAPAPTRVMADGDEATFAGIAFEAIHVPGHSPGHLAFWVPEEGVLFSGDALFAGGIGRTDLPGGDATLLMSSLRKLLRKLPDEARIHPGHGPLSTVGNERRHNPFLI